MSQFRFILNDLKNAAIQASQTSAVALAKGVAYSVGLTSDEITVDNELLLTTNGNPSPYRTAKSDEAIRNNLILTTPDGANTLEIYDARINVTQENVIVKTPLTGRRGTVKEYIQASDYKFDVTGSLITDVRNSFPLSQLRTFLDVMRNADILKVQSIYMDTFLQGDDVVMESYSVDQQSQKYVNIINFKISLVSDENIDFRIDDKVTVFDPSKK